MQIEGRNPVLEALRAGTPLSQLDLEQNIKQEGKIAEIVRLAESKKLKINFVPRFKLDQRSLTKVHQGVIAVGSYKEKVSFGTLINDNNSFIIYVREALYEHNIGAIVRTAECLGATGVVLTPKTEVTPQVRRAAMGATEHIPVINYNMFQAIKEAKKAGLQIVGIERTENSVSLPQAQFQKPLMLIIGGEDRSLSPEILNKCDMTVEIPMKGKVNSLNMSVAAAVTMYEVVRQFPN